MTCCTSLNYVRNISQNSVNPSRKFKPGDLSHSALHHVRASPTRDMLANCYRATLLCCWRASKYWLMRNRKFVNFLLFPSNGCGVGCASGKTVAGTGGGATGEGTGTTGGAGCAAAACDYCCCYISACIYCCIASICCCIAANCDCYSATRSASTAEA